MPQPPSPEEIAARRKLIEKAMLQGYNEHDGSLDMYYIGDLKSVPALPRVLKDNQPMKTANGRGLVICTYSHAIRALKEIIRSI